MVMTTRARVDVACSLGHYMYIWLLRKHQPVFPDRRDLCAECHELRTAPPRKNRFLPTWNVFLSTNALGIQTKPFWHSRNTEIKTKKKPLGSP